MAISSDRLLNPPSLLMQLADGRLHSGERLAQVLGVSRAAVWKGIERLRMRGIDIEAVPRRGYKLPDAVELLEERAIRGAIAGDRMHRLRSLDVLFDVDSTMSWSFTDASRASPALSL